jgi:hypothetical protein
MRRAGCGSSSAISDVDVDHLDVMRANICQREFADRRHGVSLEITFVTVIGPRCDLWLDRGEPEF